MISLYPFWAPHPHDLGDGDAVYFDLVQGGFHILEHFFPDDCLYFDQHNVSSCSNLFLTYLVETIEGRISMLAMLCDIKAERFVFFINTELREDPDDADADQ